MIFKLAITIGYLISTGNISAGELSDHDFRNMVYSDLGIEISPPINCNYLHQDKIELPLRCIISDYIMGPLITIQSGTAADNMPDQNNLEQTETWQRVKFGAYTRRDIEHWGVNPEFEFRNFTSLSSFACVSGTIGHQIPLPKPQPYFLQKATCDVTFQQTGSEQIILTITVFDRGICADLSCNLRKPTPAWDIHAALIFSISHIHAY